jgi:hypothetical protein
MELKPCTFEGLPLRKSEWKSYLDWTVESFLLCSSGVADETQVQSHMCYAEFNDIIDAVSAMDADVISIETSRSKMELLDAFKGYKYPNVSPRACHTMCHDVLTATTLPGSAFRNRPTVGVYIERSSQPLTISGADH